MIAVDPVAVRRYVEVVFANPVPGSYVALRGLPEPGKGGETYFEWVDADAPSLVSRVVYFAQACARRGIAAFCIPGFVSARGRAGAADVVGFSTICADFDTGDVAANLRRAAEAIGSPSLVVNSGGWVASTEEIAGQPKRHAYWRVTGEGVTPDRIGRLRALVSACFQADASFAGRLHQPIRIAGSIHNKAEPTLVSVAYAQNPVVPIHVAQAEVQLERIIPQGSNVGHNSAADNPLGFQRKVSLDELAFRRVTHGDADINRFEAISRMMGSLISGIADTDNVEQCEREFGYFRAWAIKKVENVERDYDLKQHWRRLLNREKSKRAWRARQPRRRMGAR